MIFWRQVFPSAVSYAIVGAYGDDIGEILIGKRL